MGQTNQRYQIAADEHLHHAVTGQIGQGWRLRDAMLPLVLPHQFPRAVQADHHAVLVTGHDFQGAVAVNIPQCKYGFAPLQPSRDTRLPDQVSGIPGKTAQLTLPVHHQHFEPLLACKVTNAGRHTHWPAHLLPPEFLRVRAQGDDHAGRGTNHQIRVPVTVQVRHPRRSIHVPRRRRVGPHGLGGVSISQR
ncbi:MAG: hypothetical protein BWX80_02183 [Candidatus Hydrogenedentes bacterium ADurb.Bin101]|nr:MAG: hypothetical protein BWX80_02183 [Candidatus Hydrogenedentes bacterium ADurb.Bin101]